MVHSVRNFLCNRLLLSVIICLAGIFVITLYGNAADPVPGVPKKEEEKIHISAETLTVDSGSRYAEFSGNVKVIQGDTTITSDRLRIFYNEIPGDNKKSADVEKAIQKIIAQGHVKIKFEDKIAETEEAVYTTKDKIFVLSGDNSKITTAGNSISGSKITLYRTDGRIKIESSKEKPVEAIFYSGENQEESSAP